MPHNRSITTTSPAPASDATRLRVLAGTPHSRRGSVLVLVVGVLALLAIIIVVYTSVGQADVRGGRTLVNQARLDDQSRAISEQIRSIVGEDATAVRVHRVYTGPGAADFYASRETSDYPYTDPYYRSNLTLSGVNADYARFNPAGNITNGWTAANEDPRATSDPFLATTTPTWSNRDTNRLPPMPTPFALMGHHRDWGHLSIISPSGLPVNLAALRGNFSAPSGFTQAGPYTQAVTPAMSDWLYLWNRTSATAGFNVTPTAAQVTPIDQYNSPATWSNDRLETFRPTTWNPAGLAIGDVKFMGNTLGDADGDGYYDSVWQELVDASDPSRPTSLLQGGTGVRWFIAPRIIDLSSMVNLNTATSFAVPPDFENPAGITPSDVDLERLLTLADARQYFGVNPGSDWIDGSAYNNAARITEAGYAAFAGILEARVTGLAEVGDNRYTVDVPGPDIVTPLWLRAVGVQRPAGVNGNGVLLGSITRNQLYTLGGKDEANGQLRVDSTGTYLKQNGGFGLGDEREFRAFGYINDARGTSRVEAVANYDSRYPLMSPFRSLRDFVTDRDAGSLGNTNVTAQGETVPASFAQYFTDVRHLLTTVSGSRPIRYSHLKLASATDPASRYSITEDDIRVDINPLIRNAVTLVPDAAKGIYPLSAANEIFTNYALALSPFLGDPDIWDDATAGKRSLSMSFGGPTYKTATTGTDVGETDAPAFRGRAAEVALRTAAHMTLNLLAMRDDSKPAGAPANQAPDNRPLAATVLLDATHRTDAATVNYTTGSRAFPFWPQSLTGNTRLTTNSILPLNTLGNGKADFKSYAFDLDMGVPAAQSRLAGFNGTNTLATGYAINIFAAQPQPFVTAAVSFDMYYDAPIASGGDSPANGSGDRDGEWILLRDAGGNPIGIQSLGITMRGDVQTSNKDFLLECVAFQVTNPFDVPITLGDTAAGSTFSYYFEFAGKYYDAAKYDNTGVRQGAVTLAPRQSICFYVLNDDPVRVQQTWQSADSTISSTAVQDWLNKQLTPLATGSAQPIRTVQISAATGNQVNPGAFHDSFNASATDDSNKVIKLWRVVRQPGAAETATNNDVANDYLVDRLHDPDYGNGNRAALYRRLDSGNNRFETIDAGPEPSEPESAFGPPQENVGYAITFFGAIRRRTDPNGGPLPGATAETMAGVMPAWCMEPKTGPGFTASTNSKNVTEANAGINNTGVITGIGTADFAAAKDFSDRSFKRMVGKGITRNAYTTAGKHPASRDQSNDIANLIGSDLSAVSWTAGNKSSQLPVYPRRNGTKLAKEVEKAPLRPADLLLPWAIGPYQNPTLNAATAEAQLELRHTTLSEAIAFGLNYSASTVADSYEFQIGKVLDRGHLPTDRYAPFNDLDSNGEWTYGRGAADPYIANGVPFALNVLDRFRTTRYGTVDSAMPGLINLNTASIEVLRTLPFLTPASAHLYGDDGLGLKGNWMNDASAAFALKLKDESGNTATRSLWKPADDRWDVAAVLAAYRDKQAVVVRGNQKDESGASRVYADFSPRNDGKNATDLDFRGGRAFMTNCVNVRTEPGFKSVGEIMLALVQDDTVRANGQSLDAVHQKQLGIDRLAAADNIQSPSNFQTVVTQISDPAQTTLGVDEGTGAQREQAIGLTAQASLRPATVGPGNHFVHGGKSTDYDRKIAIANALLNTVSTRSDIFCAYFLVNGYTEGDVQGLEPWTGNAGAPTEDRYTRPMTPSIQRRYMMVLDRSQCTRPGDKPKMLMFEELPVR